MNSLAISNLKKSFGDNEVIRDLSFSVPENTIYGFLGQNGAGKTTTMKMVLGLLKPSSGSIHVCGEEVRFGETKTNHNIGFLPDVPEFYGYMKPMEYLSLCGEITGLERRIIKNRSEELLTLVGLDKANKRIGGFSRGMKQRLGIAQALFSGPKLLICDEPTSALDPIGRKEILDILLSIRGKTTIVFSTHILSDVERICDHVAVLHKGSLVLNGTLSELKQGRGQDTLRIEFSRNADAWTFLHLESIKALHADADDTGRVLLIKSQDMTQTQKSVYGAFSASNIYPERAEILEPSLESLFMEVVK